MVHVLLSEEEQEQEQEADTATASEPAAESIRKERPVHQEKHDTPRKPKQKGTFSSLTQKQTMHRKAPPDKGKAQKGAASSVPAETFRHTPPITYLGWHRVQDLSTPSSIAGGNRTKKRKRR